MLNKLVRTLGYCGVYLLTLVSMYLLSFIFTAPLVTTAMLIISIVTSLPERILTDFWRMYLICCIPLAIVFNTVVGFNIKKYIKK